MGRNRFDLAYSPQPVDWDDYLPFVQAADRPSIDGFWAFDHLWTNGP